MEVIGDVEVFAGHVSVSDGDVGEAVEDVGDDEEKAEEDCDVVEEIVFVDVKMLFGYHRNFVEFLGFLENQLFFLLKSKLIILLII